MPAYKDEKKGTWYVSFHYFDWTGKNVRKLKRGFATKRKAQEWEQSFLRTKAASMDMTFSEFFTVYEKDVRPKLKENTWWSKEHIIRTKIIPYFGNTKMVDVTVRDIIKWQNMMREYRDSEGKPYSPTYLKSVQAQLSCLFNHAVRFYELPSNPVHRAGALGAEEADEMLFWTKEESLRFIPTMANKPYSYYAFELLYWCGIRMGELRALTAEDFDFEKNILSITKSYQKIKGKDLSHLSDDTIKNNYIRPQLRLSSVTIVLIGAETGGRWWVDWEIYFSLRKSAGNERNGILGILIPNKQHYIPQRILDNPNNSEIISMPKSAKELEDAIERVYLKRYHTPNLSRPLRQRNSHI